MSNMGYSKKRSGSDLDVKPKSKHTRTATSAPYIKRDKPPHPNSKPRSSQPKPNAKSKEEVVKRRKLPITQGGGSENEDEHEDEEDQQMDVDDDESPIKDDSNPAEPAEKRPRLTKVERAALHAAQPHRTSLLPSHPLLHDQLLPRWETARRADLSKEERRKAVHELWNSVKGRVGEVSRGHKGGRVLQTVRFAFLSRQG